MSGSRMSRPTTGGTWVTDDVQPDPRGNRKARRAAQAKARKAPRGIFDPRDPRRVVEVWTR